ncbi:hypothetical protein DPEC_G00077060 [Dallia pectoralis]|uniref:Uncharacterized protein n=1 Tax=Dallia pectoralis TaxID=75939 RepID=A0ACC2H3Q9_DALPE|nr:hypothetical protein DPEC_G00077060 [Dallia pectoralis]
MVPQSTDWALAGPPQRERHNSRGGQAARVYHDKGSPPVTFSLGLCPPFSCTTIPPKRILLITMSMVQLYGTASCASEDWGEYVTFPHTSQTMRCRSIVNGDSLD